MFYRIGLTAFLALVAATSATAAPKKGAQGGADYGRDLISVATPGRNAVIAPTATCTVWINAEGLGVGPTQLGGMHGIAMQINEHPLSGELATSFAAGLASAKAANPDAPAWFVDLLERNREAIQARCAEDQPRPLTVYTIKPADKRNR